MHENIIHKTINGEKIFYNKELDVISKDMAKEKLFDKDYFYERTILDGVYDTCFEVTTKCNQCCRNCFSYSTPSNGQEMKYEDIEKYVREIENDRIRIGITGGEPFLHSNIDKILELPIKFKGLNFMLSSNGTFDLTNELEKSLVDGQWLMSISIHGNKETHNLYTDSNSFDKVITNLSKLNKKIIIHTYTVINRYMTKKDVDYILDLQKQYRIFFTRFILPRNLGRVDLKYDESVLNYVYEKVKNNEKAGVKKDYSHTELVNVKMKKRIIG